jgi:hypothetical protein
MEKLTADQVHDEKCSSTARKKKPKVDKRPRSVSISVVAKDAKMYKLLTETIRTFRCLVTRLAAQNMLILQATSEVGKAKLIPYFKAQKGAAAALYGVEVRKAKNYELRSEFFRLWSEFQQKAKNPGKNIASFDLPSLGSWIWDANKPRFDAAMAIDLWKRIDGSNPQRFKNFGMATLQCNSRPDCAKIIVDDATGDIQVSFKVFKDADPFILVAKGVFEKKGELFPKKLNNGHESLLRRFANGSLEWSDPRIRLTKKGELILDVSYKKGPWVKKTDAVKNRVFEVTLLPATMTVSGKKDENGEDLERTVLLGCEAHVLENGNKPSDCGKFNWKGIYCADVVSYLDQFEAEKLRREEKNDASKSNRDRDGLSFYREAQQRASQRRYAFVKDKCHVWAKEIVGQAKRFNAEALVIRYPVKMTGKAKDGTPILETISPLLHGYKWGWDLLTHSIRYHGVDAGFVVREEPMVMGEKEISEILLEEKESNDEPVCV